MAYKRSQAAITFHNSLKEVKLRCRKASSSSTPSEIREYVVAAAIFLGHAALENYVADSFEGFVRGARAKALAGADLPKYLQAHLFIHRTGAAAMFSAHHAGGSELALLKSFSAAVLGANGGLVDRAGAMPAITAKDVYGNFKYPSERNLVKLFARIGVPKVFDRLSATLKGDASALLESIGSLRTQLAHTGTLPGISVRDVRDRLGDAAKFVGALDRVLYKSTVDSFGQSTWNAHCC